jgi:hypothetical protein
MEIAGIRERSRLQNKNPDKGKWPILTCIALSTKNVLHYKHSCRFLYWQPSYLRLQGEACRKQDAWRKKQKYASFLWFRVFPLQLFPLQLLQDHRDGNIEASGVVVLSSFHQAVPGGLQIVVPVRNV